MELNLSTQFKERMNQFIQSQTESLNEKESCISHRYKCSKCKDLTFIFDGKEVIPCKCKEKRETKAIYAQSGICDEFIYKKFGNFNYAYDLQIMEAFNTAKNYAKYFNSIIKAKNNSIIFMGPEGCGKTHLSLAIANNLINRGVGVVYMPYVETMDSLMESIEEREEYSKVINKYKEAKVLLIDDLFGGSISDTEVKIMSDIIKHRYINNKAMIINSRKYMVDLSGIDDSVVDIILQICKGRNIEIKGSRLNYRVYG